MEYFYNGTLRKVVGAFGSLFDDIKVVSNRKVTKVPFAYGPKQRFLARIQERTARDIEDAKIAIKLPRIAFEMSGLSYDTTTKVNRLNKLTKVSGGSASSLYSWAPYTLNIQLSILSNNEHEAQQILEQIIYRFQPDYTITIAEDSAIGINTDVPIVLDGVSIPVEYEGDFTEAEKVVTYDLDFTLKIRFYGPDRDVSGSVIRKVIVNTFEDRDTQYSRYTAEVGATDDEDDFAVVEAIDYFPETTAWTFSVENVSGAQFTVGATVFGVDSGTNAVATLVNSNTVNVNNADGIFYDDEVLSDGVNQWKITGRAPLL